MNWEFRSAGFAIVEDFVDKPTVARLLGGVEAYRRRHDLPVIERRCRGRDLRYQVIDGTVAVDAIPALASLLKVIDAYVSRECGEHVRVAGRAGVNVNITPPGGSYRWHFDRNAVTAVVYLNVVAGGDIELCPNQRVCVPRSWRLVQRWADAVTASAPARALTNRRRVRVTPQPGRLLLSRGDRCLHSVRSVGPGPDRIALVVAYDRPGRQRDLPGLDSYLYSTAQTRRRNPQAMAIRRRVSG